MKEVDYLLRYASEIFALLPTGEKLESGFPHANGCSGGGPLTSTSELIRVGSLDPQEGAVGVRSYFLRCGECKIKREYRAK